MAFRLAEAYLTHTRQERGQTTEQQPDELDSLVEALIKSRNGGGGENAIATICRHQKKPPVDVNAIAHDLGIRVYYRFDLESGISGKIMRNDNLGGSSGFAIVVNARDNKRRRRFTLAHEVAHYVLHRDLIDKGSVIVDSELYRSNLSDFLERQANRLAADILMPAHLLRRTYQHKRTAEELAVEFDVSKRAMEIRLSELDLAQFRLEF